MALNILILCCSNNETNTLIVACFLQFLRGLIVMTFYVFALTNSVWVFGHQESSNLQTMNDHKSLLLLCCYVTMFLQRDFVFLLFSTAYFRVVPFYKIYDIPFFFPSIFRKNVDLVVNFLMRGSKHKLLFCWVSFFNHFKKLLNRF